jgi:hypothetical protein
MFKSILAASIISLAAVTSANAASPASPASAAATVAADRGQILEVQHRRSTSERHARSRDRYHGRYHPGRRYGTAPRGWHRYAARPYNWQTRGCILVGPVWFCP